MTKLITNIKNTITDLDNLGEKIAFVLLKAWISLPIFMMIFNLYNGYLGNFADKETIVELGLPLGAVVHVLSLNTYITLFNVVGIVSIIYSFCCLLTNINKIFSKEVLKNHTWLFVVALFMLWKLVSTLLADNLSIAFFGSNYLHDGYFSYVVYVSIFLISTIINKKEYRRKLCLYFALSITLISLLIFIQCFEIKFLDYCFAAKNAGVFNNLNHFGYMLCVAAIILSSMYLFNNKHKTIYLIAYAFITYCLLINDTFGAYIALFVGLIVTIVLYILNKNKLTIKTFLPLVVFIFISILSAFKILPFVGDRLSINLLSLTKDITSIANQESGYIDAGTGRMELWKDSIYRITQKPIFGFGQEGLKGEYAIARNDVPHNEYLAQAVYSGIPGGILYVLFLVVLFIDRIKKIKKLDSTIVVAASGVITYSISALFGNAVFNTAPYFWMFLGLCAGVNEDEKPLLSPIFEQKTNNKKKKPLLILLALTMIFTITSFVVLAINNESSYEKADLEAMKTAEVMARGYYEKGSLDLGEYYFDGVDYMFVSIKEDKPVAYGFGTSINAKIVDTYNKENNTSYEYDGSKSYKNKIIKLTLLIDSDNNLNVKLNWE